MTRSSPQRFLLALFCACLPLFAVAGGDDDGPPAKKACVRPDTPTSRFQELFVEANRDLLANILEYLQFGDVVRLRATNIPMFFGLGGIAGDRNGLAGRGVTAPVYYPVGRIPLRPGRVPIMLPSAPVLPSPPSALALQYPPGPAVDPAADYACLAAIARVAGMRYGAQMMYSFPRPQGMSEELFFSVAARYGNRRLALMPDNLARFTPLHPAVRDIQSVAVFDLPLAFPAADAPSAPAAPPAIAALDIRALASIAPRSLWLDRIPAFDLARTVQSGSLASVRSLALTRVDLVDLAPLAALTNLVVLNINSNQVESLAPLGPLDRLARLDARRNNIADIAVLRDNAFLPSLHTLLVESNRIPDVSLAPRTPLPDYDMQGRWAMDPEINENPLTPPRLVWRPYPPTAPMPVALRVFQPDFSWVP